MSSNNSPVSEINASVGSPARHLRRGRLLRGFVIAATASVISLTLTSTAFAATPGAFNVAQCDPNTRTIKQTMEAYRSYTTEYVVLRSFLKNRSNGATSTSGWFVGTGTTAQATIVWSSLTRGTYDVYYQWASWNRSLNRYDYSGWYRLTSLSTLGTSSMSGVYFGGSNGICKI